MISKADKKKIQKIIGHRYVADVQSCLKQWGIVNKDGEEHSASMITNVMNGKTHDDIEAAIYEVVAQKKAAQKQRKEILKSK
ncbi:hypothetical protein [Tenacibaculum mesophilum]|uniref:hypothetical protein n=1 Tax=Tenacibaculum mesophilum TaxID=104268 RepID=UPI0024923BE3|nr:hypothetical protein [Tenacibaculum mesophilum]